MSVARCYIVVSPEYGTVIPVLDYGQGPMEYGRDVLYAYARTADRAKVLALRAWRRLHRKNWRVAPFIDDGGNPFRGIQAMRVERLDIDGWKCWDVSEAQAETDGVGESWEGSSRGAGASSNQSGSQRVSSPMSSSETTGEN